MTPARHRRDLRRRLNLQATVNQYEWRRRGVLGGLIVRHRAHCQRRRQCSDASCVWQRIHCRQMNLCVIDCRVARLATRAVTLLAAVAGPFCRNLVAGCRHHGFRRRHGNRAKTGKGGGRSLAPNQHEDGDACYQAAEAWGRNHATMISRAATAIQCLHGKACCCAAVCVACAGLPCGNLPRPAPDALIWPFQFRSRCKPRLSCPR